MDWIRDQNNVVVVMGVSSVDKETPIPITIDSTSGAILAET